MHSCDTKNHNILQNRYATLVTSHYSIPKSSIFGGSIWMLFKNARYVSCMHCFCLQWLDKCSLVDKWKIHVEVTLSITVASTSKLQWTLSLSGGSSKLRDKIQNGKLGFKASITVPDSLWMSHMYSLEQRRCYQVWFLFAYTVLYRWSAHVK